ncbi:transient receptor potential cation channel subfamily V member 1-like [Engraulis encrasicolus]|uniref:transient receptor potential cation channel subfamily V member 1-like n=1 Tax=Engraulis encrasicolus TaxID=184585 RepID=UPI002FD45AF5
MSSITEKSQNSLVRDNTMGTRENQRTTGDTKNSRPLTLELDDKTDDKDLGKVTEHDDTRGLLLSVLKLGESEKDRSPMDSEYQENNDEPRVKNVIKGMSLIITGEAGQDEFDMKRLFAAVSSGDVAQLNGLEGYLRRSMKHLTDTEYQPKGKTALLKALLNLKDGRNDAVECLLGIAENMGDLNGFVNAAYTDSYYKGQTALHVAIERRSKYFVELLVQKGADVHAKACGKFFQLHKGHCFYFGELPLSLAACTSQKDIVDFLLDNRYKNADVREPDSRGNIVLHALVMVADNSPENTDFIIKMYDHILTRTAQLHPKVKLEEMENKQGLTPIKLAAKTGKIELLKHILHREFHDSNRHLSRKFTEWAYGPVGSSLYDLSSLDTFEKNSILQIVVYGTKIPNRLEMLQLEPLNQLLEEKWKRFVYPVFLFSFVAYLIYLGIFCTVAYFRKDQVKGSNGSGPPYPVNDNLEDHLLLSGQIILLLASVCFFLTGLMNFRTRHPRLGPLLIDGFFDLLFVLQAVLFMACTAFYLCGRMEYLGCMVLCLALSWVNLLYYSRGSKNMGIYSVMIQKLILGDMSRFLLVYMVFLVGYSAAIVTLVVEPEVLECLRRKEQNHCSDPTHISIIIGICMELFKFAIGIGNVEFTGKCLGDKVVVYVLLISYIVLTYILLLNMLIALMNKTVAKTSEESTNIWRLQRAIAILDIERRLPKCLKRRLRSGVEKDLGQGSEEDRRWCFRVEEVNWTKWNMCLRIMNEDPGNRDLLIGTPSSVRVAGTRWRRPGPWAPRFLGHFTQHWSQQEHQGQELDPLSSSPVKTKSHA